MPQNDSELHPFTVDAQQAEHSANTKKSSQTAASREPSDFSEFQPSLYNTSPARKGPNEKRRVRFWDPHPVAVQRGSGS